MFKNKKVIIFDMDGTLIDSLGVWNEVDKRLINKLGYNDNLYEGKIQEERDNTLRLYSKEENPYIMYCKFLKEKYNSNLSEEEILKLRYDISKDYLKNVIDYKKDVEKFLRKLKEKNFILVIASTTRKANIEIYKTENKNIINKAKIDDYFELVYTREDAKEIKPNPEIYLKVVQELNVRKEECLIFEDSLIGIEAAKNAGIECTAIYDRYSDLERKKINEMSNYQVDNYLEALEILEKEIK